MKMEAGDDNFLPVHIGLHKAGSTFLQHNIFPLMYPGAPFDSQFGIRHPAVLKKYIAGDIRNLVVVSDEKLSGHLEPSYPGHSFDLFAMNVKRMTDFNYPVRVLLVLREHREYLRSAYLQRFKRGFRGTFSDYLGLHSFDDLSWSRRIDLLDQHQIPVLIVDHADLVNHPCTVIRKICEFWCVSGVDQELLENTIANPSGYSNITPVNGVGIRILRTLKYIGKMIEKSSSIVTRNRAVLRWENLRFQENVVKCCNKLGRSKICDVEVPDFWQERLAHDWTVVGSRIWRRRDHA
jgi:hypothetical protein